MGFFTKLGEWVVDHKWASAGIAAGVGFVTLSSVAKASQTKTVANPNLPGTKNVQQMPGGGLITPTHVIPPPHPAAHGATFYVTTHDPAPQGNLNARANDEVDGNGRPLGVVVGYWAKNEPVEVLDPGPGNGMVFARGAGIDIATNQAVLLEAWASSMFLAKRDDVSDLLADFPVRF